jgi:hypothetical protein
MLEPGVPLALPIFGRLVNPISTKEADFAHQLLLAPPKVFTFRHPWTELGNLIYGIFTACNIVHFIKTSSAWRNSPAFFIDFQHFSTNLTLYFLEKTIIGFCAHLIPLKMNASIGLHIKRHSKTEYFQKF